jgi:hypothetical protein
MTLESRAIVAQDTQVLSAEEPVAAERFHPSPAERWAESDKLRHSGLMREGFPDPEPNTQSRFFQPDSSCLHAAHGRPRLRALRRCGV